MRRLLPHLAILLLATGAAAAQPDLGSDAQREAGKALYGKYCSQCHGDAGDGNGVAAERVKPRPRDFTAGKYKIRTTPSGSLPTTADLVKVIRDGLPYTSMPPWPQLSEQELTALAYYLKTFSPRFADAGDAAAPMSLPEPPPFSEESAAQGAEIYKEIGCLQCHGQLGRGDGTSAPTLTDDWGHHIRVADLSKRWTFRGGPGRKDIFRAFTTALNGTPMPSYADSLSEDKRWQLTDYVWSLSQGDDPGYDEMVTARKVLREIDLSLGEELFEAAPRADIPVIGQIMEPGREFYPSATEVEVRAVYNESDIAFEVRWNDMRAETTGANRPDLVAPRFEEDPYLGAAAASAGAGEGGDDFWGDAGGGGEDDGFWDEAPAPAEAADDFWAEDDGGAAAGDDPTTEFSDAVAIQLPSTPPAGNRKPYFLFGDAQNPVDIWFADLARSRPELLIGRGSGSLESQGASELSMAASYDRGQWTVMFKRPLRQGGVAFEEDRFLPIAFSVWDGFNRERGNKRALSRWVSVYLEPGGEKSVRGPVLRAVAGTLVVELLLIGWVRRRYRAGALPD